MTYMHAVKCLWRMVLRRLQRWMKEASTTGGRRAYVMPVKGRVGFPGLWSATCPRPFSPTCCLGAPPFLQRQASSGVDGSSLPSSR